VHLNKLAECLPGLTSATGQVAELDRVIQLLDDEAAKISRHHAAQPEHVIALAGALRVRYEMAGDLADLNRAVKLYEKELGWFLPDSPARLALETNLATLLQLRYEHLGNLDDLQRSIEARERAIAKDLPDASLRADLLSALGTALKTRFDLKDDLADLGRAIEAHEQALALTPPASPRLPLYLNNLAVALQARHMHVGDKAALDRAIDAAEQAVRLTPPGSARRPARLGNLSGGLRLRYQRTGRLADLERAIQVDMQALDEPHLSSPQRPIILGKLAHGLLWRYDYSNDQADLDGAIQAYRQSVELTPQDSPAYPLRLSHLGTSLRTRYEQVGDLADLNAAIQAHEEAVRRMPADSPAYLGLLGNLGASLALRYGVRHELADLNRAIQIFEHTVKQVSSGSIQRSKHLGNLANALRDRYDRTGRLADLKLAIKNYRASRAQGLEVGGESMLEIVVSWALWARQQGYWRHAMRSYQFALEMADRLLRSQLLRRHKESELRFLKGLPAEAAYAMVMAGDPKAAAVALEWGRALLLSEALERDRANLDRLPELGRSDLHTAYREAAERVSLLVDVDLSTQEISVAPTQQVEALQKAREGLGDTITESQRIPGYEEFSAVPGLEDLAAAVVGAPLVYLVSAEEGGLALIVRSGSTSGSGASTGLEPTVTPLPLLDLTNEALRDRLIDYTQGYQRREDPDSAGWLAVLDRTTRWLWDAAMGPLLDALPADSSVTLIAGGYLGLLPLHAACTEDPAATTGRRYALDQVLLTYAPNARALVAAQQQAVSLANDRILCVDEPQPVSAARLANSAQEVAAVRESFPSGLVLRGEAATREAVLSALDRYPLAHLSCHGAADADQPLASGLLMAHDQRLTIRHLLAHGHLRARLAVLSACETAALSTDLPDEVVSLATGLLQAGFAGVIGSLWSVPDRSTMALMVRFYELWRDDQLQPAEALRRAQQWLRDTTNAEKHNHFQGAMRPQGQGAPTATGPTPHDTTQWEEARSKKHPVYWAAFAYVGA